MVLEVEDHKAQLATTSKKLLETQKLIEIHKDYGVGGSQNSQEESEKQVDYTTSQEKEMDEFDLEEVEEVPEVEDTNDKGVVPNPRRCGRLKGKEHKKVEDLAIERAQAKNNAGQDKGSKSKSASVGD
ncbi:uncharacterized protein LOC112270165 [Brachypodium distachyon]|uniref:Uncharacterized protein n=1 Tax=Brachypodium distachyon TaxID=15368 RepID=A0A2K2DJX6_BRADI|nr:uncharacterized protein LOC112270165 [Brachypodium distachyon]PNT74582.1 hypothetical protein BRADI_1g18061v3 [Brachypodium distachyon]|eukprot:XP_024313745.1 uncharacterized protein LOC112270165 [Brachypodium distachyon]